MTGHVILYLGHDESASQYVDALEKSASCERLIRSDSMNIPAVIADDVDLIMFEAGPAISGSGQTLQALLQSLAEYPVVAVTRRANEHRGIAAVRAGAQAYLCIDDADEDDRVSVFDHAMQRHRLIARLSDTDSTVLSILNSINDGVIVIDSHGHVLDINPAARSILGLAAREQPSAAWSRQFCNITADGKATIEHDELPLVKACRGEKFSDQASLHRAEGQADTVLSINGQGLFDQGRNLIGGVITFRDVTDVLRKTVELEKRAQYHRRHRGRACH